jgi:branched-subunit amino acid ABC-type transport system permease component
LVIVTIGAFFDRHVIERTTTNGFLATAALVAMLAGGTAVLQWTPIGRRFRAKTDAQARAEDDQARTTPGKVRRPTSI